MKKYNYISLIVWVIVLQLIGIAIGMLSIRSMDLWYINLNKSSLNPPDQIFGIAWTILYLLIAIAGWVIWSDAQSGDYDITSNKNYNFGLFNNLKHCFIIQMLANWLWMPIFFYLHQTGIALFLTIVIITFVYIIILRAYRERIVISLLLTPYLLWSVLAFYLNGFVYINN